MKCYLGKLVILCICLTSANLHAQQFEDFVRKYTDANGKSYMQPLADAFGANLNSGWYHSAYIAKPGFQIYLGVSAMAAPIPAKNKTFTATTQGFFTPQQTADAPTIFGKTDPVEVKGDGGTAYVFPGGLDLKNLPMAVPNLSIGSLFGTSASLRWAAYDIGEDVGKVKLLGWGLTHSLDQYLPVEPFHVAFGFYMQQFAVGDIVDANGWLANVHTSYQLSFVTLYGGLGYENSNLDISYTYEEDNSEVSFNLKGNNNIRATVGFTLNLGPVKLNTDYSLASQSILTVGFGLGLNEVEKIRGME